MAAVSTIVVQVNIESVVNLNLLHLLPIVGCIVFKCLAKFLLL